MTSPWSVVQSIAALVRRNIYPLAWTLWLAILFVASTIISGLMMIYVWFEVPWKEEIMGKQIFTVFLNILVGPQQLLIWFSLCAGHYGVFFYLDWFLLIFWDYMEGAGLVFVATVVHEVNSDVRYDTLLLRLCVSAAKWGLYLAFSLLSPEWSQRQIFVYTYAFPMGVMWLYLVASGAIWLYQTVINMTQGTRTKPYKLIRDSALFYYGESSEKRNM
jgi:hypothetical protein